MRGLSVVNKYYPHVTTVIEAPQPLRVEVVAGDGLGGRGKHEFCALAQACKRLPHVDYALISRSVAYLISSNTAFRYLIGPAIQRELISFDRGAGFTPGVYELKAVPRYKQLGYEPHARSGKKHKNSKKKFRHITVNVRPVL